MFSPGKKNWILKFFSLIQQGEIPVEISLHSHEHIVEEQIREVCEHTGIIYGVPNQNLYVNDFVASATRNEKLQVLLFESLLFIEQLHQKESFKQEDFINRIAAFYQLNLENVSRKWYEFLSKSEKTNHIENLLSDRIKVHSSYSDKNFWFNHLTNGFLYLDLIMFHQFCSTGRVKEQARYNLWVDAVLTLISAFTKLHTEVEPYFDPNMFKNLMLSAELPEEKINQIKKSTLDDDHYQESIKLVTSEPMLAMFTFHFMVFLYHEFPSDQFNHSSFLNQFGLSIGLKEDQTTEVFWECRKSMSNHSTEFYHLISESESKILTTYLARKYNRILGRNKDRLIQELKESKELVYLVRQSTKRELTAEEKEKVKTQSMDLMKSVPSIGIYLIPGGALWLPIILKLLPDLLPSAFKENEVDGKK